MPRTSRFAILALVVMAALPRLFLVLAPRPDLYGPGTLDAPRISVGEEVARGSVAAEILRGPLLPVLDYQYDAFSGGTLIEGILAIPPFLLFGQKLWALKLVPIGMHLAAVALLFRILDRFVSRRAAWIGGLLLAWTPPGYTILSTVAVGSHIESNTLALLAVYLFLDLCQAETGRGWRRAAFGVLAGISAWFNYDCLIFLIALAIFDFLVDRAFLFRKEMLGLAAGLLVGLVPWLVYNLQYDFAGLHIYGKSFAEHVSGSFRGEGPAAKVAEFARSGFPNSFFFRPMLGLGTTALGILCTAALLGLTLAAAWFLRAEAAAFLARPFRRPAPRVAPNPALIAFVYMIGFVLAFAITDFEVGRVVENIRQFRYPMTVYPFLYMTAAIGLDRWIELRPALLRPASIGVGLLCLLSTAGVVGHCDLPRFGAYVGAPGTDPEGMGRWYVTRFCEHPEKIELLVVNATRKRTPEQQAGLYEAMGRILRYLTAPGHRPSNWDREHMDDLRRTRELLAARVPETYRAYFTD